MKIVVLDQKGLNPGDISLDRLKEFGDVKIYDFTENDPDLILDRIGDSEIVLLAYTKLDRDILSKARHIKYIGVLSTGYNSIDLEAAREFGIVVCNTPGYGTDAVAQFSLALLLELCLRVGHHNDEVRKGRWREVGYWHFGDYPLIELADKTIGIIGLGQIGLAAAKIYKAMGMEVLAYNRSYKKEAADILNQLSLDEVLEKSDIIDLHLPLNDETRNILDDKAFYKMKDGVIIINTARGGLIDEKALMRALDNKKVYAAGLDVVKNEPIDKDNPLLKYDNVIVTPHMAWGPTETREKLLNIAIENLKSYLDGKIKNQVN